MDGDAGEELGREVGRLLRHRAADLRDPRDRGHGGGPQEQRRRRRALVDRAPRLGRILRVREDAPGSEHGLVGAERGLEQVALQRDGVEAPGQGLVPVVVAEEQRLTVREDQAERRPEGEALLADFGIATVLDAARTKPVESIGSPRYMAPEQFDGIASMKSDQYALGCIAYELITGHKPFMLPPEASWFAWGYKHRTEAPLAPTHLSPRLPTHIEQAILTAMAKDRTNRHSDIAVFVSALHKSET